MSEASVKPVSMKCKICGGDLANDYMLGACVCENCGNRWSLADLIPNYKDYSRIIEKLNKAKELLADGADEAQSGQALILYKSAEADCLKFTDAIASDLLKLCNKGQEDARTAKIYASGKSYLEKENFRKAFSEFEKNADAQVVKGNKAAGARARKAALALMKDLKEFRKASIEAAK